jgi:hypothetical protein
MRYSALDDARSFLLEAKGLPPVRSGAERLRRCMHACILLSWIALEDGLDYAIEYWGKNGQTFSALPTTLKERISTVLSVISAPPMDDSQFSRLRKIRNRLTHPKIKDEEPKLTVEMTEQTFQFCLATLRALSPYTIICPFDDMDSIRDHSLAAWRGSSRRPRFNGKQNSP